MLKSEQQILESWAANIDPPDSLRWDLKPTTSNLTGGGVHRRSRALTCHSSENNPLRRSLPSPTTPPGLVRNPGARGHANTATSLPTRTRVADNRHPALSQCHHLVRLSVISALSTPHRLILSKAPMRGATRIRRHATVILVPTPHFRVALPAAMSFVCCICPTNGPICGAGGRGASTVIGRTGLLPWSCRLRVGHPSRQSDTPNRSRGSGPAFTSVEADSAIIRIRSTRC